MTSRRPSSATRQPASGRARQQVGQRARPPVQERRPARKPRLLRLPSGRWQRAALLVGALLTLLVAAGCCAAVVLDSRASDRARTVMQQRLGDRWDDAITVRVHGALLAVLTGRTPQAVVHLPLDVMRAWAPQGQWSDADWAVADGQLVISTTVTRAGLNLPVDVGVDLSADGSAVVATPAWIGVAGTTIDASQLGGGRLGRLAEPIEVDVGASGVRVLDVQVVGDGVDLVMTTERTE